MRQFENLVLKGGGILGTCYAGAYEVLERNNIAGVKNGKSVGILKRVAGTSAGAIFSSLIALGYSSGELTSIAMSKDFTDFTDFNNINDILANGGVMKGDNFLVWINSLIADMIDKHKGSTQLHPATVNIAGKDTLCYTFNDLNTLIIRPDNNNFFKSLHIFSVLLGENKLVEFSKDITPETPIACAVRCSMSIPLVFEPYEMLVGEYAGKKFVDGGAKANYPITTFDFNGVNYQTLGLNLSNYNYFMNDESFSRLGLHAIFSYFRKETSYKHEFDEAVFAIDNFLDWARDSKIYLPNLKLNVASVEQSLKKIEDISNAADNGTDNYNEILQLLDNSKIFDGTPLENIINKLVDTNDTLNAGKDKGKIITIILLQLICLYVLFCDFDDLKKSIAKLIKEIIAAIEWLPKQIIDFIEKMFTINIQPLLLPLTTIMQAQENINFDRDATRTINLNTLGLNFADFAIPTYAKKKLYFSGITCTEKFLEMMIGTY